VAGIREGPSTRIWVYHGCICKGAAGYLNSIVVASSPTGTRICSTISSGAISTTVAVPDPGRCIFSTGGLTNNTSTGEGPHDTATSTSGLDMPGHDDRDITPFIDIRGSVSHDDIAIFTTNSSKDGRGCSCIYSPDRADATNSNLAEQACFTIGSCDSTDLFALDVLCPDNRDCTSPAAAAC